MAFAARPFVDYNGDGLGKWVTVARQREPSVRELVAAPPKDPSWVLWRIGDLCLDGCWHE